ncbi:MAG: hypothetical protein ACM31O_03730 [Bacteroidota bacterium]
MAETVLAKLDDATPALPAPKVTDKRQEYRQALTYLMSEAARGAVGINMWAPAGTPAPVRLALGALGGAGLAGMAAVGVVYRGAMKPDRPVAPPDDLAPQERIARDTGAAGATAAILTAGLTRNVERAARTGLRVSMATLAGTAAAELVEAVDTAVLQGNFVARTKDLMVSMVSGAKAAADSAAGGDVVDKIAEAASARASATKERVVRSAEALGAAARELVEGRQLIPGWPIDSGMAMARKAELREALERANAARVAGDATAKQEAQRSIHQVMYDSAIERLRQLRQMLPGGTAASPESGAPKPGEVTGAALERLLEEADAKRRAALEREQARTTARDAARNAADTAAKTVARELQAPVPSAEGDGESVLERSRRLRQEAMQQINESRARSGLPPLPMPGEGAIGQRTDTPAAAPAVPARPETRSYTDSHAERIRRALKAIERVRAMRDDARGRAESAPAAPAPDSNSPEGQAGKRPVPKRLPRGDTWNGQSPIERPAPVPRPSDRTSQADPDIPASRQVLTQVEGFWRSRRVNGREVREFVRPHTRRLV